MGKKLLNRTEAAAYLGFDRKTLEAWNRQGRGPDVIDLPSGRPAYCIDDLIRFIDENRVPMGNGEATVDSDVCRESLPEPTQENESRVCRFNGPTHVSQILPRVVDSAIERHTARRTTNDR
jgi:hypothetical protein